MGTVGKLSRRIRFYYLPFGLFSLVVTVLLGLEGSRPWIPVVTDVTGYISIAVLTVVICIGPANVLFKRSNPVSTYLRRDLGIIAGSLAVLHSGFGLFVHLKGRPWLYFTAEVNGHLVPIFDRFRAANDTGALAALLVLFLLAISNDLSLKSIGVHKWKTLQRLTYLMLVLVLTHAILYSNPAENPQHLYRYYLPGAVLVISLQLIGVRLYLKIKPRIGTKLP